MRTWIGVMSCACVLTGTAVDLAGQSALPFDVEPASVQARSEGDWDELHIGIRDSTYSCRRWVIDVLVLTEDRLVSVSSVARPYAAPIRVQGMTGRQSLVVARCSGRSGYSLHGPFEWRARAGVVWLDYRARRTVQVSSRTRTLSSSAFSLLMGREQREAEWPRCRSVVSGAQQCIGVPTDDWVVAVASSDGALEWALVPPATTTTQRVVTRATRWGRLLRLIDVDSSGLDQLVVSAWRSAGEPPNAGHAGVRPATSRIRLRSDPSTGIHPVGTHAAWVVGEESPTADRFVEVRGGQIATTRVAVSRLAQGPADHPYVVPLRPDVPAVGSIVDPDGEPVAGAVVSAFELVAEGAGTRRTEPHAESPRRWIAESTSAWDGAFSLSGLEAARYEFVVAHPTKGRVIETRRVDGSRVTLRLRRGATVLGRVFVDRLPAAGVGIRMVPDREELLQSVDPIALLSPPGWTDTDGRFELALPAAGGGEVVVGGDGLAIARYRLEATDRASGPRDLGDIYLPAPLVVVVRLEAPGCGLVAVGPVGSLGLDVVRGVFDAVGGTYRLQLPEAGFWWLEAECGTELRAIVPPVMRIRQEDAIGVVELTLAPAG